MDRDTLQQNDAPETGPSVIQWRAIAALAAGATMTEAASRAGVDRATVHRWRRSDPEFIAALNGTRAEAVAMVRDGVRGLGSDAVATLRSLLADGQAPAAVRLKTALAVLQAIEGVDPKTFGPTDPRAIRGELAIQERRERLLATLATMRIPLNDEETPTD